MRSVTVEEENRLSQTLALSSNNKYYVYMLCKDGKVPFYVGKGCGLRVLAHLDAAEVAFESIESDNLLSEEQKGNKRKELTEKIQTILSAGEKLEMVIVKWGLSSYEAFMCESAVINAFSFVEGCTVSKLTNIVNGHASKLEKNSVADVKTKARTLDAFLNECAIPVVGIDQIADCVAFIKINRLYLDCVDKETGVVDREKVKDCVRGIWPIAENKRNNVKYIFALYRARIVGIFRVIRVSRSIGVEYSYGLQDFPTFPPRTREQDKWAAQFATLEEAQQKLSYEEFERFSNNLRKNKDPDDDLTSMRRRVYFVVDDQVPPHLKMLENCLIRNDDKEAGFLKAQWPVHCNF